MWQRQTERPSPPRVLAGATAALAALALLGLVAADTAAARPKYGKLWKERYPDSQSAQNMVAGTGQLCFLCHGTNEGPPPGAAAPLHFSWNPYGWELRRYILSGLTPEEAFAVVEQHDSDADPTGSTNLEEIASDTQPGWTDGPHNTVYRLDGSVLEDWMPPKGTAGDLNPPGVPFCDATPNSTGRPARLSSSGSSVVEENVFTLHAAPVPDELVVFFYGAQRDDVPFGRGRLCVGGPLLRLPATIGSGNVATLAVDLRVPPEAGRVLPGSSWAFQAWYVDRSGGPPGFNTSDGLALTFR